MFFLITISAPVLIGTIALALISGLVLCKVTSTRRNELTDDYTILDLIPSGDSTTEWFYFKLALINRDDEIVGDFTADWDPTSFTAADGTVYYGTLKFDMPDAGESGQLYFEELIKVPHVSGVSTYRIIIDGLGNPPYHDVHDPR